MAVTTSVADAVPMGRPTESPSPDALDAPQVRAWIAAARDGDAAAFGEIVRLTERAVFRTALAALGDPADAEDVAQEAFVLAWRKLSGFRGDASIRTWLLTIAWRKALDRRRSRRLAWLRRAPISAEGPDPVDLAEDGAPDPERAAVAADLVRQARREIDGLSPKLRDTLLLAASGEHSYEQIAILLGIPVGTVKWRVSEARRIITSRCGSRLRGESTP